MPERNENACTGTFMVPFLIIAEKWKQSHGNPTLVQGSSADLLTGPGTHWERGGLTSCATLDKTVHSSVPPLPLLQKDGRFLGRLNRHMQSTSNIGRHVRRSQNDSCCHRPGASNWGSGRPACFCGWLESKWGVHGCWDVRVCFLHGTYGGVGDGGRGENFMMPWNWTTVFRLMSTGFHTWVNEDPAESAINLSFSLKEGQSWEGWGGEPPPREPSQADGFRKAHTQQWGSRGVSIPTFTRERPKSARESHSLGWAEKWVSRENECGCPSSLPAWEQNFPRAPLSRVHPKHVSPSHLEVSSFKFCFALFYLCCLFSMGFCYPHL